MKYVPFLLIGLLFTPHVVSSIKLDHSGHFAFVPLRICSGDEPHYLLQINSLLHDGDLDLANNYAAARIGGADAGEHFRSVMMNHHVNWYQDGYLIQWHNVFKPDGTKRPGQEEIPAPKQEYSQHPPGLAVLLAVLLSPLPDRWVEPGSLWLSGAAVAFGLYWFCELIRPFAVNQRIVYAVAIVAFFGTPAVAYGRTLFTEPYLLACAVGSLYFYLRRSAPLAAGALVGLGMTMKPPFAVLLLPMMIDALRQNRGGSLTRLCFCPGIALTLILGSNQYFYGSPFRSSQQTDWTNSLPGAAAMLLSPEHGLIWFIPAIVIAAVAAPTCFRRNRRDATILLACVATYFAVMASWGTGGYCYATRLLVPIMPLLIVPMTALPTMRIWRSGMFRWSAYAVCALSLAINIAGAVEIERSWGKRPWHFLTDEQLWSWRTNTVTPIAAVVTGDLTR
jgi:hypothetical protein